MLSYVMKNRKLFFKDNFIIFRKNLIFFLNFKKILYFYYQFYYYFIKLSNEQNYAQLSL